MSSSTASIFPQNKGNIVKMVKIPLAFAPMLWYNSRALVCAYSNKEVDFHG